MLPFSKCFDLDNCTPPTWETLASTAEANQRFEELIWAWVHHCSKDHHNHTAFLEHLGRWTCAFQELVDKQSRHFTQRDHQAVALLEVNRGYFELSIACATVMGRHTIETTWWDSQISQLDELVDRAAATTELYRRRGSESSNESSNSNALIVADSSKDLTPSFSLESGINMNLYSIAVRCRDPRIRRKAIALLRRANKHEGLWRSDVTAHVAERIVELEEEGLGDVKSYQDVPADKRILDAIITLDPSERDATIRFVFKDRTIEEPLTWRKQ